MAYLRRILPRLWIILALFLASLFSLQRAEGGLLSRIEMQAEDILTVYIDPAVVNLTARCEPLGRSQPFILYVASNSSARSLVQLYAEGESYYNITLSFESPQPWQIRIGVLTYNPDAYRGLMAEQSGSRFFMWLPSWEVEAPGSYVVNILAHVEGVERNSSIFFQFPSAFTSVLVASAALALAYVNIFAVTDSYFRNKSEGISRQRKIGIALMIIGSIILVYWVYGFAVAAQPSLEG